MPISPVPMKVGLLLSGQKRYSEGVMPLSLTGVGMKSLGVDVLPLAFRCGSNAMEVLEERFGGMRHFESPQALAEVCDREEPDLILTTDTPHRLSLALRLRVNHKTLIGVFTSAFHGFHALVRSPPLNPEAPAFSRFELSAEKLIPFAFLTRRYRDLLKRCDYVVGISKYATIISRDFYGTKPAGVIYPPVELNYLQESQGVLLRSGFLIFVGGRWHGDVSVVFPTVKKLVNLGHSVNLFGDESKLRVVEREFRGNAVRCHYNVPTDQLLRLYQGSVATLILPDWEAFGYVGPESILCGTPVVAECIQPWMELVESASPLVRMVGDLEQAADAMVEFVDRKPADPGLRARLADILSPDHAARSWIDILDRQTGRGW